MGRIADAALELLATGPADIDDVAARLARSGVTRARDPIGAVRRALRGDPRVIALADGRIASVAQALTGLELTTRVTTSEEHEGRLDVEPDLAPLTVLGLGPTIDLPAGIRAGDVVSVRVDDPEERAISIRPVSGLRGHPADEAAVIEGVRALLTPFGGHAWAPIASLATVAVGVAADNPGALRRPGRPLSEIVAAGGFEAHLGWVGPAGTDWVGLTEDEAELIEAEISGLLADDRPAEAAIAQERLISVLRRHMPERVPAARRRLARTLARAGRPEEAVAALTAGDAGDPEDWYEAAVIARRIGDDVSARRWVQSGLARADRPGDAEVERCLADLEHDLDAQARYARLRDELLDITPDEYGANWLAGAVASLTRPYLVEALMEELAAGSDRRAIDELIVHLADAGDAGRDACLAMGAVLPRGIARRAREAAGRDAMARSAAVAGLVDGYPDRAWATRTADAPDQRQVVITIARGDDLVSALIALIDIDHMGGALKDGFFLPDMVEARLRRELLEPMHELGLTCEPIPLGEATAAVAGGLQVSRSIGWHLPSLAHQPVLERLSRYLIAR